MPEATTTEQSPLARLVEFSVRLKNRDKHAIVALFFILFFVITFLVGFGYLAARVGRSEDFGVIIRSRSEMVFPAWSVVAFPSSNMTNLQCHHCHYKKASENCNMQPLLSYITLEKNAFGYPSRVSFNTDASIIGTQGDDDYIRCSYNVTGGGHNTLVLLWQPGTGVEPPKVDPNNNKPEAPFALSLTDGEGVHIGLRENVFRYHNGVEEKWYERTNQGYSVLTYEGSYFDLYYSTYVNIIYSENSEGLDKVDFWQFMGYVGGMAFLFWIVYKFFMYCIEALFFRGHVADRGSYQAL